MGEKSTRDVVLTRPAIAVIAIICGALGLYGWAVAIATASGHDGVLGRQYYGVGTDWMVFYSAAKAYWDGNLPLIFDGQRFTQYQNENFRAWLSGPLPFHPWLYPPHYLLILLPFGRLPFGHAGLAFQLVTAAALVAALWLYIGRGPQRLLAISSVALCPAASINVIVGQNAFLIGALFVGGFGLLSQQPILGGMLLGLLSFKPSLCLMVPVALIAARQWRALASAGATASLLALVSLAIFGSDVWWSWLQQTLAPSSDFLHNWLLAGRLAGQSIYACAWVLGASYKGATIAQACATLLSAITVFYVFRRRFPVDLQIIILLATTILAAPHVSPYDALLLAIAASLFLLRAFAADLPLAYVVPILVVWLCPLISPPLLFPVGLTIPGFIALFVLAAVSCAPLAANESIRNPRLTTAQTWPVRAERALLVGLFVAIASAAMLARTDASTSYRGIILKVLSDAP